MADKIKPTINGTAETMLLSFYARAKYSKKKGAKFHDAKAEELIERIDYDFAAADKDTTMSSGVIARTIVIDELVTEFIDKHPDCTVVNIACGLDTRFYRMDNGRILWYNLDLPEVIALRDQIYQEKDRPISIGSSAIDPSWTEAVKKGGNMLFIIEGLSMYLTTEENAALLKIIRDNFDTAYIIMECLAKMWVKKETVEKSVAGTGAKFLFGADCFEDLGALAEGYKLVKNDNILRGMRRLVPAQRLVDWLPIAKKMTQKILVFEKV